MVVSNLRVKTKLLGKVGVGWTITEVLMVILKPHQLISQFSYVIYDRYHKTQMTSYVYNIGNMGVKRSLRISASFPQIQF